MTRADEMSQTTRRRFLVETAALAGAAGLGLDLDPADATPASMQAAIRNVTGEAKLNKGRV
jgi:nitrous oxide reductase